MQKRKDAILMEVKVDVYELEKQRRKEIKKSGNYLEFTVTIGVENEFKSVSVPVISTELHGCGPKQISALCAVLLAELEELAKDYPSEFAYAALNMKVGEVESFSMLKDYVEEVKKEKKEEESDENKSI